MKGRGDQPSFPPPSPSQGRGALLSSERLLLFFFFLLLVTLLLVANYHHRQALSHIALSSLSQEEGPSRPITVWVTGAVAAPQSITLPAGSRIADLKGKVVLTEKSDKRFFQRKKILREGEEVVVPEQKRAPSLPSAPHKS